MMKGKTAMKRLLLTYYGDDFTGSTDSMEALTSNGFRTVLFLKAPDLEMIENKFPDIQCVGIAGISRSLSPDQMERELLPIFQKMKTLHSPLIHYKVCSTFDSSPEIGSIGKVLELAKQIFPSQRAIPVLAGAPSLQRFTVFGNHFAKMNGITYRLDRHPTMSRHPVTPMHEADLRLHLKQQTSLAITLFDVLDLQEDLQKVHETYQNKLNEQADVVLFDVLDENHLEKIGSIIWKQGEHGQPFVVGSSGVQYALAAHWKKIGIEHHYVPPGAGAARQVLVVSGSCSPVTQHQIEIALQHGFCGVKIPVEGLIDPSRRADVRRELFQQVCTQLQQGKSVIIYSAWGPDDPGIAQTKQYLQSVGMAPSETGKLLGEQLGRLTRDVVEAMEVKRVVVAGGDTSGYVTKELGIYGLEVLKPIAPGAPLCRCYAEGERFDGLELALKSGQFGQPDYFVRVLHGN